MRLLLVDDEERLTRVLARGLAEEGHDVHVCATGADASELALTTPYDVILLDRSLPDLDGLSLLHTWRARGLPTPVLVLSARGSPADRLAGLRAGAHDYAVKPVEFADLLARLEALHARVEADRRASFGTAPARVTP